jgi:hypothetical protein
MIYMIYIYMIYIYEYIHVYIYIVDHKGISNRFDEVNRVGDLDLALDNLGGYLEDL